jgi:hypothetical protein
MFGFFRRKRAQESVATIHFHPISQQEMEILETLHALSTPSSGLRISMYMGDKQSDITTHTLLKQLVNKELVLLEESVLEHDGITLHTKCYSLLPITQLFFKENPK